MTDLETVWEDKEQLPEHVRKLIREGHAANTRKAYQSDLRAFHAWGGGIPTTPGELARYIAEEGERLHPSTIERRLAAISTAHKLIRGSSSPTLHPVVKAAMRGLRRRRGIAPNRAASPLMLEDLWAILDCTGESLRDQRDRALLLLGFAGGFRRSELVGLDMSDLELVREGLVVTLRRSKTDQEAEGRRVGIPRARGRWCPVKELWTWLGNAALTEGPVFRSIRKGGYVMRDRLSTEAVSRLIKRHVIRTG